MAFRQQFGQESENVNFTPLKNASTFKFYKTKIPKTLSYTKTCSKEYELIGRAKEYELMINRFKRVGYSQIEK